MLNQHGWPVLGGSVCHWNTIPREGPATSGIQLNKALEQPGQPEADLNACCWFCDDIFVLNPSSAHSAPQKALPCSFCVYGCVLRKCNLLWRVSITSLREQLWGPGGDHTQRCSPAQITSSFSREGPPTPQLSDVGS